MHSILKFFHKLWNPHCRDCQVEDEITKQCASCDILREQLSIINEQNRLLLNKIVNPPPDVIKSIGDEEPKPIATTNYIPWRLRQQMLEEEDRKVAQLLRNNEVKTAEANLGEQKEIEKLEAELGLKDVKLS